jgi:CheY-like chemotaxis protein
VTGAANGPEALIYLRRQIPDLILLDRMMALMDGRQFRERLLRGPAWSAVPVVPQLLAAVERYTCADPTTTAPAAP